MVEIKFLRRRAGRTVGAVLVTGAAFLLLSCTEDATETNVFPVPCSGTCEGGLVCARVETDQGVTAPICVSERTCGIEECETGRCALQPGTTDVVCIAETIAEDGGTRDGGT